MLEDDIFKLLLVVLLLANESGGASQDTFRRLNEILIVCMLMGASNSAPCCSPRRDRCNDGCGCDRGTSF